MQMKTKKVLSRAALVLVFGAGCLGAGNAFAAPNRQDEIRELRQQIEALRQQNEALSRRLEQMEQGVASQNARIQAQETKIEEQAGTTSKFEEALEKIGDRVSIHGTIDADMRFRGDYEGNDTSEFAIDSVEVEMAAELAEWAKALALFKYEEHEVFVDEGYITLGETETMPAFLKVGKMVTPFGDYSTNMLQDPFTQTLGEINEGAGVIGYSANGFTVSAFAYNGLDEVGDDAQINGVGAAVRYDHEAEEDGPTFSIGAGLVNNLASSGGIGDALPRTMTVAEGEEVVEITLEDAQLHDMVAGLNIHAGAGFGGFGAIAEYTTALDNFHADDLAYGEEGAQPSALNTELSYTTEIAEHETVFAIAFQKTWEAVALELPEFRYSAAVAVGLIDGLTLTLEGFIDQDYDEADGGTGDDGYGFTTRLSYEF